MCNKEYNGYTNYETWCVNLWIDNDQGLYYQVQEMTQQIYDEAEESNDYNIYISKDNNALRQLEDQLKDFIEEMNPLTDTADMFSDLLNSALSEVDWREIAENWLETVKEGIS